MNSERQTHEHLLHVLSEIQQRERYISDAAMERVATQLALPVAQVCSVVEFYSFFHRQRRGDYDVLFSNCTSCGDLAMMQQLCAMLGVTVEVMRADGRVTVGQTSCIGMCDQGPALLVNGQPLIGLDAERLAAMAALIEQQSPLAEWPQAWFAIENHVRKKGLMLTEKPDAGFGLKAAIECGADATLLAVTESGLRGRGGAGFGAGMKWRFCREAKGEAHYVICNADEGEPGTFKDRVLLRSHADELFEGMTVAGFVIHARKGYLYLRGEYRYLLEKLHKVLARRRAQGLLGENILGRQGFDFDIEIVVGAGAYICGEESALIESLEEKRGVPRIRPPFPVTRGYRGQPTVVNNVETLVAAAHIAAKGAAWFNQHGTQQSAGSKLLSISGDCAWPGVYEYDFGITIRQVLDDCGAEDVQAVQVGGPSGSLIGPDEFDRQLGFEALATGGSMMIYGPQRDLLTVVRNFAHFFEHESCGFCTPCRVGTGLLRNGIDKITNGHGTAYDVDEMRRMALLVKKRSHCGLGQTAPNPLLDALEKFPQLFESRLLHKDFEPDFDLDASLAEARLLSHRDDAEAHL